ncbi:MAG: Ig-like domain repeat protein, partial [Candidatus Thermoplasmatota archaeon]
LFFVDRMYIGKALTDSSGRANLSYTFDLPPKPYTLTVIFYGDYYYLPSTAEAEIKILKEDTTLTYIGNLAGQYSDNVTLSAVLVDQDTNIGISNKTISFKLEKQTVFASTNESGIATIIISLIQLPAQYNLTVTFSGDDYYLKSENVSIFTVEKEDTVLIAYDVLVIDPINNTLIATLLEDGYHIVSRNINFYINSTYVGLGFTNESGMAVYPIPFIYLFGNFTYTAEFAGDPYYLPSNDSAVLDTTYDARVKAITTQITNLIESIQNSTIDQGTKNSLISKLQNARSKVYQENFNAANNIMNAFQNELNAQRGKKIPEELYQTWYAQSEMIRYGLQWMMAH